MQVKVAERADVEHEVCPIGRGDLLIVMVVVAV